MKKHPIQLEEYLVKEISLKVESPFDARESKACNLSIKTGHSEYNEKNQSIMVGLTCEITPEDKMGSYKIFIDIVGIFSIGEDFPKEKVTHWSENNAPQLLMPYLREAAYGIAIRAGLNVHLPLVILPTVTIKK